MLRPSRADEQRKVLGRKQEAPSRIGLVGGVESMG